ncbi:hypothetical protein RAS2_17850 [Phycisphaerae bacterium RAS2]|nr:hypothetical protein RAS2_17850 [Phycisphaerae bacterium RAS2]
MASDYLTLDEVCEMLGKTPTDVKRLVADGQLRELHDAGTVFYKRSEVVSIAEKEGSSIVNLAADDELGADALKLDEPDSFASALSSLADSSSGLDLIDASPSALEAKSPSDSALGDSSPPLELTAEEFPEELPAAPKEMTSEIDLLPDDEADAAPPKPVAKPGATPAAPLDLEVPDLGLSGSSIISLEPDLDDMAPAGQKSAVSPPPKNEAKASKGISVFDDDEIEIPTDPMGETRISSGMDELEAVGSGSGLLDISQENDDTSLGSELLDVISPSPEAGETADEGSGVEIVEGAETVEDSGAEVAAPYDDAEAQPVAAAASVAAPRRVSTAAMAGAMQVNVTLVLGVLAMALVGLAAAANVQGVWPAFLEPIARGVVYASVFGGLAVVAIGMGVWGILAGRK